MRHFRTLTEVPDFSSPPDGGIVVDRQDTGMGTSGIFSRWPAAAARTQNFSFVIRNPTEMRDLRLFLQRHRGGFTPFYVPTWTRDFGAIGTIVSGDDTLVIDRDPTTYIAENRDDTVGRFIYVFTPARDILVRRVLAAASSGPNWSLTLDVPLTVNADATRCLCGWVWLARITGDELRWQHIAPDRATIDIGVRQLHLAQDRAGTYDLSESAIEQSEPFVTVEERNEAAPRIDMRAATALGPDTYSVAQAFNFNAEWTFELDGGSVTITKTGGGGGGPVTSSLYDDDDTIEHISGAFDTLGDEALAWQSDFDTIRMRWFDSGVAQALDVDNARTPVLLQNWTVNGAITGGEADVVLYYLKPGDSKVFARIQRESFATEHVAVHSPVMPLALSDNRIDAQNHELRGVATSLNRVVFTSDDYLEPLDPVTDEATGDTATSGSHDEVAIDATSSEDEAAGDTATSGSYTNQVIDEDLSSESEKAAASAATSGAYVDMAIEAEPAAEENSGDVATSGSYDEKAQDASGSETASGTTTTSGTYESA